MQRINVTHVLLLTCTLLIVLGLNSIGYAKQDGAPSSNTNSPGDGQTCARTSCHTGSASAREGLITTNVPASGYLAGNTYLITVSIDEVGITEFGFQASPQSTAGDLMGVMELIDVTDTKLVGAGKYITHTSAGTDGTDTKTWTFNWTPDASTGPVTFYTAINASNDGDNATGDKIYTSFIAVNEDPANIPVSIATLNPIRFDVATIAQNEVAVTVVTPLNDPIVIDVLDLNGRIVSSNNYDFANGTFIIPISEFMAGLYFIRISNAQGQLTKQFFKR